MDPPPFLHFCRNLHLSSPLCSQVGPPLDPSSVSNFFELCLSFTAHHVGTTRCVWVCLLCAVYSIVYNVFSFNVCCHGQAIVISTPHPVWAFQLASPCALGGPFLGPILLFRFCSIQLCEPMCSRWTPPWTHPSFSIICSSMPAMFSKTSTRYNKVQGLLHLTVRCTCLSKHLRDFYYYTTLLN